MKDSPVSTSAFPACSTRQLYWKCSRACLLTHDRVRTLQNFLLRGTDSSESDHHSKTPRLSFPGYQRRRGIPCLEHFSIYHSVGLGDRTVVLRDIEVLQTRTALEHCQFIIVLTWMSTHVESGTGRTGCLSRELDPSTGLVFLEVRL